jgi:hypothetical protein
VPANELTGRVVVRRRGLFGAVRPALPHLGLMDLRDQPTPYLFVPARD